MAVQLNAEGSGAVRCPPKRPSKRKRREEDSGDGDEDEDDVKETEEEISEDTTKPKTIKKRTVVVRNNDAKKIDSAALCKQLFAVGPGHRTTTTTSTTTCCHPPERRHDVHYHRPLLLLDGPVGRDARRALLAWYDGVSTARGMPWRKPWVDPAQQTRAELATRAYQVWISEVMAQQTRIAVVVDYWTRWMARWPTVAALAAAEPADVVAAWRGLGYYSRAARLHAAARALVDGDRDGLLPADAAELQKRVAGAGRYTAGAVSAIVFGRAAAMVDGNVVRVLSRQMGLYAAAAAAAEGEGGVSQKTLSDLIWAAAEALVAVVARDSDDDKDDDYNKDDDANAWPEEAPLSDRPGRWGQALMELGSTVCTTPTPNCGACPIQATCRAYGEGLLQAQGKGPSLLQDLQEEDDANDDDQCPLCEPFPEVDIDDDDDDDTAPKRVTKRRKPKTDHHRSAYFDDVEDTPDALAAAAAAADALPTIVAHARLFPLRRPKKPVRVVDTLVCAVRARVPDDGGGGGGGWTYLLQQRPAKGLLAGLWQLPSEDVPGQQQQQQQQQQPWTAAARRRAAEAFVRRLTGDIPLSLVGQLDSVPWLFSHIRQTMHVYLFAVEEGPLPPAPPSCCWASAAEAEETYTMGTGMRKCWRLVQEAA